MLTCDMDRHEKRLKVKACGTIEDILTELGAVVSEVTRTLLNPSENEEAISRRKQIIIGALIGGVEHGADGYRKDREVEQNGAC